MNGHELNALARETRQWFLARGAPERFADEIQAAAAETIWKTYLRKKIPLAANKGYYFTAAKRQVAEEIKQLIAPYRIGGRAARRGIFTLPSTISLNDATTSSRGKTNTFDGPADARSLQLADEQATAETVLRKRALDGLMEIMIRRARRAPPSVRAKVLPVLRAAPMPMIKRRNSRNATWNQLMRVGAELRYDPEARRLWHQMIGNEEATAA